MTNFSILPFLLHPTTCSAISVEEELYVALVTPALHYCMGGLKFDTEGRILKDSGAPIPGLYGAGEVTGGHACLT